MNIQLDSHALCNKEVGKSSGQFNPILKIDLLVVGKSQHKFLAELAVATLLAALHLIPENGAIFKLLMSPIGQQNLMMNVATSFLKRKKFACPIATDRFSLVIARLTAGVAT